MIAVVISISGIRWLISSEPWILDQVANEERLAMTFNELFLIEGNDTLAAYLKQIYRFLGLYVFGTGFVFLMFSKIDLFNSVNLNDNDELLQLRNKNWLINEANLIFYVDPSFFSKSPNNIYPERLYLYQLNSGEPINDFLIDNTINTLSTNAGKKVFGGMLETDDNNKPWRYKFRITGSIETRPIKRNRRQRKLIYQFKNNEKKSCYTDHRREPRDHFWLYAAELSGEAYRGGNSHYLW